jgi:glycosyltransferase involved in cell wall biosynthesis
MLHKKISIITPSLNRASFIEYAIQSVIKQDYPNFEHIIVDGGSKDGTVELLRKYKHIVFVSESDNGMYDALNKGLKMVSGDIIGFLNTDDMYENNAFRNVSRKFYDNDVQAVKGCANVFNETANGNLEFVSQHVPGHLDLLDLSNIGPPYFNAWFFRSSVFETAGHFDPQYQISGDRELLFRVALNGLNYVTLNNVVYNYREHLGSLTLGRNSESLEHSAAEKFTMTGSGLERKHLPRRARDYLLALRMRCAFRMIVKHAKAGRIDKVIYYVQLGLQYEPSWLLKHWKVILPDGGGGAIKKVI